MTNRKAVTLLPIIKKWILPGTIAHCDCRKAYNKLEKIGYTHVTVNHSKEFVIRQSVACTNSIGSNWRHAKVHMAAYGTHLGDHAGYLTKFMWHQSNSENDKFLTLINDINMKYLHTTPSTSS